MHVTLRHFTGGVDDTTLDQQVGQAVKTHCPNRDVKLVVQPDPALEVEHVQQGDDKERNDYEAQVGVDANEDVGSWDP